MTHDLAWFTARIGKDIIRMYGGYETTVLIPKTKGSDKYFYELQDDGFTFKDTVQTIAEADTMDLEQFMDKKKASKPRIHVSDISCESCSS